MSKAEKTVRVARPEDAPNIKSFTLEKTYVKALKRHSKGNETSVSAVVREIIESYLDQGVTMLPKEPQVRTSVWVPPELWEKFRLKTEANGVTMSDVMRAGIVALEAA
jgi:hypothetical protein